MSETPLESEIAKLSRRIEDEPSFAPYYILRSRRYSELNLYHDALADADKAVELAPRSQSYKRRGECYFAMEKYDEALVDYCKAIEINPDIKIENILDYFEPILKAARIKYARTADYYERSANSHFHCKQYELAVLDYSRAIKLEPNAWNYRKRGDCYFAMKEYDEALADYCKAVEIYPDIEIENLLDRFEPTLTQHRIIGCTKEIKQKPYSYNYAKRGHLYFELGNYNKAIADYNKVIAEDRSYTDADVYFRTAQAHYRLGHRRAAIKNFRQALEIYPKFHINDTHVAEACFECGVVCYELKKYKTAIADFDRYIFFKPEAPEGYEMRAKCYRAMGDESKAQADFAKAVISG